MGRKDYQASGLILISILVYSLAGCKKDVPKNCCTIPVSGFEKVYVVCEGNFGNGDASLYIYDPLKDSVYGDVYQAVNHQPLGDVFQSMVSMGDYLYLCVNNSDKVVVISKLTWQRQAVISIPKPRYILPVSPVKAYVSSLYDNKVYIINPQIFSVTGTVTLPNINSEGMCLYNGSAYICPWDTATENVYVINDTSDHVAQSIRVAGNAPQEALMDKEGKIWILSGDQPGGYSAALTRIDPASGQILSSYRFPPLADPLHPFFNPTSDTLYFIEANYYGGTGNNGVFRMAIHDTALPQQAFIAAQQNQYFWALGIDPGSGTIYVGDPKGFVQQGSVYLYRQDGVMFRQFKTGVGPGHFLFGF